MATVSTFLVGSASAPTKLLGGYSTWAENVLDFSETGVSSGDVVQAIKIPSGAQVIRVITECLTAEGGVATANIGDGADVDGYDAAVDMNATAGLILGNGAYLGGGKRYSADDTLDFIPSADLDTCKVRIMAEMIFPELS